MPTEIHQTTLLDFGIGSSLTLALQTDPPVYLHHNDRIETGPTYIADVPPAPPREAIPEHECPGEQADLSQFCPTWRPRTTTQRECEFCGSSVGPSFARLNRDADGLIRGCPHCDQNDVSRTDRWGTWDAIGRGQLFADGGKDGVVYDTKPVRERLKPTYGEAACCLTCGETHDAEKIGCHLVETHPEQANQILRANA